MVRWRQVTQPNWLSCATGWEAATNDAAATSACWSSMLPGCHRQASASEARRQVQECPNGSVLRQLTHVVERGNQKLSSRASTRASAMVSPPDQAALPTGVAQPWPAQLGLTWHHAFGEVAPLELVPSHPPGARFSIDTRHMCGCNLRRCNIQGMHNMRRQSALALVRLATHAFSIFLPRPEHWPRGSICWARWLCLRHQTVSQTQYTAKAFQSIWIEVVKQDFLLRFCKTLTVSCVLGTDKGHTSVTSYGMDCFGTNIPCTCPNLLYITYIYIYVSFMIQARNQTRNEKPNSCSHFLRHLKPFFTSFSI